MLEFVISYVGLLGINLTYMPRLSSTEKNCIKR